MQDSIGGVVQFRMCGVVRMIVRQCMHCCRNGVHYPGDVVSTLPGVEHAVEPGSDDDVMKLSKVGIANNLGDKELDEKSRQEIEREEGLEDVRRSDPTPATLSAVLHFTCHILLCPGATYTGVLGFELADQGCALLQEYTYPTFAQDGITLWSVLVRLLLPVRGRGVEGQNSRAFPCTAIVGL